jgi:hypothetical protein
MEVDGSAVFVTYSVFGVSSCFIGLLFNNLPPPPQPTENVVVSKHADSLNLITADKYILPSDLHCL